MEIESSVVSVSVEALVIGLTDFHSPRLRFCPICVAGGEVSSMMGITGANDGENHLSRVSWGIGALVTYSGEVLD
jgi:hypothetical protein